jgi:gluconolactonase
MTERIPGLEGLVPDGVQARKVATGATWSEGPVWLPERGSVIWSDIPGNRILEYTPATGETTVYRGEVEFTNGRTLDHDGSIVQCSHGRRRLERDRGGEITPIVDGFDGHRLNSPNDVVVARDGAIWFTDPDYGITQPAEGHPGELEYGARWVFRFAPPTGDLVPVVTDMVEPNGLAFSPDESLLYVSDTSEACHIRVYDVVDGMPANGRVFAEIERGAPDGFRVDEHGNVWTSSLDAVIVYASDGSRLGEIPIPEKVANLCFGGPDGTELYIAATSSLYRIPTLTKDAAARR